MIFISVVIVAHNSEKTLNFTLQSLFAAMNNVLDKIEVIIINDNSSDYTQFIIDNWKKKFMYCIDRKARYCNVGRARNLAISLSSGKYIFMLDSDDQIKPRSLSDAFFF